MNELFLRRHFITVLFRTTLSFALLLSVLPAACQQNLFNVPSSELTRQGHPFFQQQINVNSSVYQSNTTFSFGLSRHTEVGFNIISLNINPSLRTPFVLANHDKAPPAYPVYTINFQKQLLESGRFRITAGTQTGMGRPTGLVDYSYANVVSSIDRQRARIITGLYYGNDSFLGGGDRNEFVKHVPVGIQSGIEATVIKEKLTFIAENISGKHALGETTIGVAGVVTHHWVLSSGFQFHNRHSHAQNAVVVEFTYISSEKQNHHRHRST